jgi:hypothetical protein
MLSQNRPADPGRSSRSTNRSSREDQLFSQLSFKCDAVITTQITELSGTAFDVSFGSCKRVDVNMRDSNLAHTASLKPVAEEVVEDL